MLHRLIFRVFMIVLPASTHECLVSVEKIDLDKNWQILVDSYHEPNIVEGMGLTVPPPNSFFTSLKNRLRIELTRQTPLTTYQIILPNRVYIGHIMLNSMGQAPVVEISFCILPYYQKAGFGKTALKQLCEEILPRSGLTLCLWALVAPYNIACQKILKSVGFRVKDNLNFLRNEDIEYELQIN